MTGRVKLTEAQKKRRFKKLAKFFSTRRISVKEFAAPPEMMFAPRYRPAIGGRCVRPSDMPEHGYETREAALAAARKFKEQSRDAITKGG